MTLHYDPATGHMCFSLALKSLKNGATVARKKWVSEGAKTHPQVYMSATSTKSQLVLENTPRYNKILWDPWQEDLLATDWFEVVMEPRKD